MILFVHQASNQGTTSTPLRAMPRTEAPLAALGILQTISHRSPSAVVIRFLSIKTIWWLVASWIVRMSLFRVRPITAVPD